MNKSIAGGLILFVIVLAGGGLLLANKDGDKSASNTTSSSEMTMKMDESSTQTATTESSEATATNTVEIKDYAFSPSNITVKKGTKVTWTNQDSVQHDVMTDTDGKGPSSELLSKGESYGYTFDEVGTFNYHCSPHPYMKASVIVTE